MTEVGTGDDYAWLYGAPSAIIHGDPEGMRTIFQVKDDGYRHIMIRLDDRDVNAWLVDAGGNTLSFLREFINVYHRGNTEFDERLKDLDRQFTELVVKHPLGGDPEALKEFKAKLNAVPTAQPSPESKPEAS